MKYKSKARISKTFYGITINPGETKEFPGYINDRNFTLVRDNSSVKKKAAAKQTKVSSTSAASVEAESKATTTAAKTTSTATAKKTSDDAVTKSGGES